MFIFVTVFYAFYVFYIFYVYFCHSTYPPTPSHTVRSYFANTAIAALVNDI